MRRRREGEVSIVLFRRVETLRVIFLRNFWGVDDDGDSDDDGENDSLPTPKKPNNNPNKNV